MSTIRNCPERTREATPDPVRGFLWGFWLGALFGMAFFMFAEHFELAERIGPPSVTPAEARGTQTTVQPSY